MNVKPVNAFFGTGLLCLSSAVAALETVQSVELGLGSRALFARELDGVPAEAQLPAYELSGIAALDWTLTAYLTGALDFNLGYGLAAEAVLDEPGLDRPVGAGYRLADLPAGLTPAYRQTLNVLNLTYFGRVGTYSLGRQAISLGQARVFSPSNLFSVQSLGYGTVDAVRGKWALGALSEFELAYVAGTDATALARLKTNLAGVDWELIGMNLDQDNWLVSFGANGGIGSVGVWQETAWLYNAEQSAYRVTLGFDTTLFDDLYLLNELHYNGLGVEDNYAQTALNRFYQLGAVTLPGSWYDSLQLNYPLNPLLTLTTGATVNLTDASGLLNAALMYNASDTLTLRGEVALPYAAEMTLDAEYARYPVSVGLHADWVF